MAGVRKTRADKGARRKPAPSEREIWINYFRDLSPADQRFELGYLTAVAETGQPAPARADADAPETPEVPA